MSTQLEWTTLPRGTHTAHFNPIQLDCWRVCLAPGMAWHWTALNLSTGEGLGCGDAKTEWEAKENSTNFARNYLHPPIERDYTAEDFHATIDQDASANAMTDCDCIVAWWIGLDAWRRAKQLGAKFSHE